MYKHCCILNKCVSMSTWFIDIKVFSIDGGKSIKELCVMNVNDVLNPTHYVFYEQRPWSTLSEKSKWDNEFLTNHFHHLKWIEGKDVFCPTCILANVGNSFQDDIFYVVDSSGGDKIKTLKTYFPCLRITNYNMLYRTLPSNIECPWRPHGDACAYKQCLLAVLDYLKND